MTKQKLMDLAIRLIVLQGYNATSISNICAEAGVTKGAFFHYFPDKESLAIATLDRFWLSRKELLSSLREKETDPLKKVALHVDFIHALPAAEQSSFGCLLGVFAQEMSLTSPSLQKRLAEKMGEWKGLIMADLEEAEARYTPQKKIDKENVANYLLSVFEGSLLMARAERNGAVVLANLNLLKEHLSSLFGQQKS